MAKYIVTSPVRIQKAKIIPSERITIRQSKYKLPVLTDNNDSIEEFAVKEIDNVIESDLNEIENIEKKEAELLELSLVKPVLKEEFSISNLDIPIQISLEKLSQYSLPIEEVEKQVQEGYDKGYKDGHQIATATLQGEIEINQKWIRRIDEVINDFKKEYISEMKQLQKTLPALASTIARHILERETHCTDTNLVVEQTKKAIESLDDEFIFKILLNPDDIQILQESKSKLMHDSSALEKVIIAADNTVEKGFCILETSTGKIDARLNTQLEKIKTRLEEKVEDILSDPDLIVKNIEKSKDTANDDNQPNK